MYTMTNKFLFIHSNWFHSATCKNQSNSNSRKSCFTYILYEWLINVRVSANNIWHLYIHPEKVKVLILFMSVPTVWRRGNKRCREPLNRWRRVHLEPSFWGGLSCYFLKAKLLSCTLKSPWMLISFSTGLMGCDWSESSEALFSFESQTI